jgi:sulfatase maturation enzyme AslB (radical SAM superfamily)
MAYERPPSTLTGPRRGATQMQVPAGFTIGEKYGGLVDKKGMRNIPISFTGDSVLDNATRETYRGMGYTLETVEGQTYAKFPQEKYLEIMKSVEEDAVKQASDSTKEMNSGSTMTSQDLDRRLVNPAEVEALFKED